MPSEGGEEGEDYLKKKKQMKKQLKGKKEK
jgi:hypothetical protein